MLEKSSLLNFRARKARSERYLAVFMLYLRQLSLLQFKNYDEARFNFPGRITGICGRNGIGKTNLLDAIYYLCFTRSYFSRQDQASVRKGSSGFRLEGEFVLWEQVEKTVLILRESGKKELLVNGQSYDRFSRHFGHYPCVIIAPDDAALITGDSRERRNFLDALLSQLHADYLQQLIVYKKVLEQRNSLLRAFAENGRPDWALLDVLDEQLVQAGNILFNHRREFFVSFLPMVKRLYQDIAKQEEDLLLFYESELMEQSFTELLVRGRQGDLAAQRTRSGIHRDELDIRLGELSFRNIASQGQRKSLLFALKLAEMDVLRQEKKFSPILLLDDVFEKLDEERTANLLEKVCRDNDGQVFITDTHAGRLQEHLAAVAAEYQVIQL